MNIVCLVMLLNMIAILVMINRIVILACENKIMMIMMQKMMLANDGGEEEFGHKLRLFQTGAIH